MPGDAVMRMAYGNNAAVAGRFFPQPVGELSAGAFADIVFLDYAPPTPLTPGNLPWHILFGVDGAHVTHTIAGGKVLMKTASSPRWMKRRSWPARVQLAPAIWKRL